jgi:hypothetical protein
VLVSVVMIAERQKENWSALLTLHQRVRSCRVRSQENRPGVSNLAQNNQARHVIFFNVAEIRKGDPTRPRLSHLPLETIPAWGRKNEGGSLMERAFRRFRDRFRRRLASITASVSGLFVAVAPPVRGYASQRMCPFCGLITSRSKTSCLECGKSLAPAR